MSTEGLWHYPATITNASIATGIAQFAPGGPFNTASTAAVINKIGGRQQMVWFTSWATDWSSTSNFLQHAWIHWVTRGLCMYLDADPWQERGLIFFQQMLFSVGFTLTPKASQKR